MGEKTHIVFFMFQNIIGIVDAFKENSESCDCLTKTVNHVIAKHCLSPLFHASETFV